MAHSEHASCRLYIDQELAVDYPWLHVTGKDSNKITVIVMYQHTCILQINQEKNLKSQALWLPATSSYYSSPSWASLASSPGIAIPPLGGRGGALPLPGRSFSQPS